MVEEAAVASVIGTDADGAVAAEREDDDLFAGLLAGESTSNSTESEAAGRETASTSSAAAAAVAASNRESGSNTASPAATRTASPAAAAVVVAAGASPEPEVEESPAPVTAPRPAAAVVAVVAVAEEPAVEESPAPVTSPPPAAAVAAVVAVAEEPVVEEAPAPVTSPPPAAAVVAVVAVAEEPAAEEAAELETASRPSESAPTQPAATAVRDVDRGDDRIAIERQGGGVIDQNLGPLGMSLETLRRGVRSSDPAVRANAIEGLLAAPGVLDEVVLPGLVDGNRGVRFVAAMCIGRAELDDYAHLVQPLLRDESPSVQAAAIYALRRCGKKTDPTPLAAMIHSDDPEVRSNAFIVLGELGDRSAAPMIRQSLGSGMRRVHPIRVRIVELQGAEALARLGSDEDLDAIRAALFAPVEQGELTILACQILARIQDHSSSSMLERLVQAGGDSARPPEIRLAAAQALAELKAPTQLDLSAIASQAATASDPLLRMQATAVLGQLGTPAAQSLLAAMLSDPAEAVRVSAAGNLLRATRATAAASTDGSLR